MTGELKDTKSEFKTAESARKELSEQLVALQSKLNLESKSTELELANAHKEVKRYEDDLADAKAQAKSLIEQQGERMGELKCARAELARLETERRDFEKNGSQTLQEAQEKCRADLKAQEKEFQKELKQERKQYDEKMEAERVKASESIEASRVENEKRINVEIKNTEKLSAQIEKLEKKLSKLEEAKKALETDLISRRPARAATPWTRRPTRSCRELLRAADARCDARSRRELAPAVLALVRTCSLPWPSPWALASQA